MSNAGSKKDKPRLRKLGKWLLDNSIGGIIGSVIIAVLAWIIGLLSLPGDVRRLDGDVKTIQADVKILSEAKGKLEEAAKNAGERTAQLTAGAVSFRDKIELQIGSLDKMTTRLDQAVTSIEKSRPELEKLRDSIESLNKTATRLETKVEQLEKVVASRSDVPQASIVMAVTKKEIVEAGGKSWDFRFVPPVDLTRFDRLMRTDLVSWPPDWSAVVLDSTWDGKTVHLRLSGNTDAVAKYFAERPELQIGLVFAVKP